MEFIGRQAELGALQRRWKTRASEFVVIYGRRRVGKTEMIRQFAKGKRSVFAVGSKAGPASQITQFLSEIGSLTGDTGLSSLPIRDWNTVFQRLTAAIERNAGRTLVILDEFQWMAAASPELPSVLQKWWDTTWSRGNKMFLIVCGSVLGFMEREVLGNRSPLFGRRTAVIKLCPLSFVESRLFHARMDLREQMRRYLICGGLPAYHKLFDNSLSFPENLSSLFFDIDAPLAEEADYLLVEELRDPKLYFSILEQLGQSRRTVTQISQAVGVERSRMPYFTKNLLELGYVRKEAPLLRYGDRNPRNIRYGINDSLLRFWFCFVHPHRNAMYRLDRRVFLSSQVAPYLDSYFGHAFETVAAELFARKRIVPRISEPWEIGSFWDRTTQIDFTVALKSGFTYLGEAKWGRVGASTVSTFGEKAQTLLHGISCKPVLVSMEPIQERARRRSDVEVYSVADLL